MIQSIFSCKIICINHASIQKERCLIWDIFKKKWKIKGRNINLRPQSVWSVSFFFLLSCKLLTPFQIINFSLIFFFYENTNFNKINNKKYNYFTLAYIGINYIPKKKKKKFLSKKINYIPKRNETYWITSNI